MAYITVADVRAEGVPLSISDGKCQAAIDLATKLIDRITRQFFDARAGTVYVDGNDTQLLHLPVPIITVSALYINNDFTTPVETDRYRVYNQRGPVTDDRTNPKIALVAEGQSIYQSPNIISTRRFIRGKQNQSIVGTFGYTEPDGTTPLPIKEAALRLAVRDLKETGLGGLWADMDSSGDPAGPIQSETTDGHTISYSVGSFRSVARGVHGLTGDEKVDVILRLYKGPIIVAVPNSTRWVLAGGDVA